MSAASTSMNMFRKYLSLMFTISSIFSSMACYCCFFLDDDDGDDDNVEIYTVVVFGADI